MTHHDHHQHHDHHDGHQGSLGRQLHTVSWLLVHRDRRRQFGRGNPVADPSRGQGRILAMLKIRDGIATKELSYLLGIRTSSLNEALAKMERAGLITREPSAEDGRIMLVRLTETGAATDQVESEPQGLFASFTEEEKEQFSGFLGRIITALEEEQGTYGPDRMRDGRRMREHFAEGRPQGGRRGGPRGESRRWDLIDDGPARRRGRKSGRGGRPVKIQIG